MENKNIEIPDIFKNYKYTRVINIKILSIDKPIPLEEIEEFRSWLESISFNYGSGRHTENYEYTDDSICVKFEVY